MNSIEERKLNTEVVLRIDQVRRKPQVLVGCCVSNSKPLCNASTIHLLVKKHLQALAASIHKRDEHTVLKSSPVYRLWMVFQ